MGYFDKILTETGQIFRREKFELGIDAYLGKHLCSFRCKKIAIFKYLSKRENIKLITLMKSRYMYLKKCHKFEYCAYITLNVTENP